MSIYKAKYGQTIFDIAVQEYGGMSGLSQILSDNPNVTLDTILAPDDEVIITPNSTNIESSEVHSFFRQRTISNSDVNLSELDPSAYVGTIVTRETNAISYINSNIWGSDSELRFTNNETVSPLGNYNRVLLSDYISFGNEGDYFGIDFTYRNGSSEQVVIGSDTGASIRVSGSKLSLYADGDVLLATSPVLLAEESNIRINLVSELTISGNTITKSISFLVNDDETKVVDLAGNVINFNILAGSSGTIGLDGTIGKLDINGSVFRFLEGSGKYIYKTIQ